MAWRPFFDNKHHKIAVLPPSGSPTAAGGNGGSGSLSKSPSRVALDEYHFVFHIEEYTNRIKSVIEAVLFQHFKPTASIPQLKELILKATAQQAILYFVFKRLDDGRANLVYNSEK